MQILRRFAMMPEDGSQVVDMMQAAKELQEYGNQTPLIVISMGELGVSTRTTGEMYGNCISFATAGIPSAPWARSMWKHFAVSLR